MEIVLNFSEKELVVNENCNFTELQKKLKKLLRDDLSNWTIAGQEVKWVHQYWPTIRYYEPHKLIYDRDTTSPYQITYGDRVYSDTIMCFSDNPDHGEKV